MPRWLQVKEAGNGLKLEVYYQVIILVLRLFTGSYVGWLVLTKHVHTLQILDSHSGVLSFALSTKTF